MGAVGLRKATETFATEITRQPICIHPPNQLFKHLITAVVPQIWYHRTGSYSSLHQLRICLRERLRSSQKPAMASSGSTEAEVSSGLLRIFKQVLKCSDALLALQT